MSSKNILLKDNKNVSNDSLEIYNIYLEKNKYNKNNLLSKDLSIKSNSKIKEKLKIIISYIKKPKIFENNLYTLQKVYNRIIKPILIEEKSTDLFIWKRDLVETNLINFFNIQNEIKNIYELMSVINYQFVFIKNINKYLYDLVNNDNYYLFFDKVEINEEIVLDENTINFVDNYYNKLKNLFIKFNTSNKKIINNEEYKYINIFKKLLQTIILKNLKLNSLKESKNIIIYGSYSLYLLNSKITYNDLDLYLSNPQKILTVILLVIYFIFDIKTNLFKLPYILGHISLRYKDHHFVDCFYLDPYTLNSDIGVNINNCYILSPVIQFLNNIRMLSDKHRINKLNTNYDINLEKTSTLLQYVINEYNINLSKLKPLNISYEILDDDFLRINLKKTIENYTKNLDLEIEFEYLIISFLNPKIHIPLLNNKNIIISRQYFGLFNEIVAEYFHNNSEKKISEDHYFNISSSSSSLETFSDLNITDNYIEIHESEINKESLHKNKNNLKLPLIENKNNIIMTCISIDKYIKNKISPENKILDKTISDITMETFLASFILYLVLKKKNTKFIKIFLEILLSFLKYNKKRDDFHILEHQNKSEYNIYKIERNKPDNIHHEFFTIFPFIYKNIFFYKNQDKKYYNDYSEFLDITTYNN